MQALTLAEDLQLHYWPRFLSGAEAEAAQQQLLSEIAWHQGQIKLFGKPVNEPRLSAWYGDRQAHYAYSGKTLSPLPWTPLLQALRTQIEAETSACFNSVLLNLYRNGSDSMGFHSDNERELGPEPVIASLSLGAERRFVLRHKRTHIRHELWLAPGSLLLMSGQTQQAWQHALPKRKGLESPRINLTFRQILTG